MTIKPGYTRVSEILKIVPSIIELNPVKFGYPYNDISPSVLANAGRRGTNVHSAIEAYYKGEVFPLVEDEQKCFNSFLEWQQENHVGPLNQEMRFYDDKLKITGCLDMVAIVGGYSPPALIDWKTSSTSDEKKWALQAAFYYILCKTNRDQCLLFNRAIFVKLDRKGGKAKTYEFPMTKDLIYSALAVLKMYRYLTGDLT